LTLQLDCQELWGIGREQERQGLAMLLDLPFAVVNDEMNAVVMPSLWQDALG